MNKKAKIMFWLLLFVLLALIPKIFGVYYMNVFITFSIFAVYSLSMNLLLGYTGLFTFGHAIFFGAGGYGTALALKHINGIALMPALGLGIFSALVMALFLAPLVSRLSGTAFAMLHLAFGQVMYVLALKFRKITGGEDGIGNFPIPALKIPGLEPIGIGGTPVNFFYFAMVLLGISTFLMWYLTKSPFGQVQVGIRDNAKRMDYLGFKVSHSKAIVYIIAGTFAGVAGSIYSLFHVLVSPDGSLGIGVSFAPLINIMVGGSGSFWGPILGTAIMQAVDEIVAKFSISVELTIGIILILVIMFLPGGILGYLSALKARFTAKKTRAMLDLAEGKLKDGYEYAGD